MAGHSKFSNIKHRKGAQDAKRGKIFTRLAKEIIVAIKSAGGSDDPNFNPALRAAIAAAKAKNMPNDRINSAIKRGAGTDEADNLTEIRYEGYASGGVAVIVDALTSNKNRAAADVRTIFNKRGGSLAESGSVVFMFNRIGYFEYPLETADAEEIFDAALEAGADDVDSGEEAHIITCEPESFSSVRAELTKKFGDASASKLSWKPQTVVDLDLDGARKVIALVDALEESDDVQYVTANFEFSDEVAEALANE